MDCCRPCSPERKPLRAAELTTVGPEDPWHWIAAQPRNVSHGITVAATEYDPTFVTWTVQHGANGLTAAPTLSTPAAGPAVLGAVPHPMQQQQHMRGTWPLCSAAWRHHSTARAGATQAISVIQCNTTLLHAAGTTQATVPLHSLQATHTHMLRAIHQHVHHSAALSQCRVVRQELVLVRHSIAMRH